MKVDINKTYKTKNGYPVVIYAVYEGQENAVHGACQNQMGDWGAAVWRLDGHYLHAAKPSEFDLVEVRPERVVWVNEYRNHIGFFDTKESADVAADYRVALHRVALHRVVLNEDTVYKGDD